MRKLLLTCLALLSYVGMKAQESVLLNGAEVPVVGIQTVEVEVLEKTAYSGETAAFDLQTILSDLGISAIGEADQYVLNMTTNECVADPYGGGLPDGWHSAEGDLSSWGASARMVCVKIQNPASGMIDYVGAIDGGWNDGETFTAKWAFVANGSASIVTVLVNFVAPEFVFNSLAGMQKLGGQTVDLVLPLAEFAPVSFALDIDAIAALLQVQPGQIVVGIHAGGNAVQNNSTANNGGWWLNADGRIVGWGGETVFFIEPAAFKDYSLLNVGHYPAVPGKVYTTKMYLASPKGYYEVVINAGVCTTAAMSVSSASQYATFCAPFDVDVPSGVTAYTATLEGSKILLTSVGETIAAGTPVILESENAVNLSLAGVPVDESTTCAEGCLVGTYTAMPAVAGTYVLQNRDGKVGFYQVADVVPTVGANRAYLVAPVADAKAFYLGDEETAIQVAAAANQNQVIYDVAGRRVQQAVKGLYIVNGKKVIK